MRKFLTVSNIVFLILFCFLANGYVLVRQVPILLWGMIPLFLWLNLFHGTVPLKGATVRLRICNHGGVILGIFAFSLIVSVFYHLFLIPLTLFSDVWTLIWSIVWCVGIEALLFWNGILCVYCTSVQLGITLRVVGAICGMIPVVNLIVLTKIIGTVLDEVDFETQKNLLNLARRGDRICQTKYPILMVHGVFFRDTKYFNYWGRVPAELEKNGARVYYGGQPSAASVADCGADLTERIKTIVAETGCEKVNIIAHSKGGLDCRYALSELDMAPYVASLTTVNTPHRGCMFADQLLHVIPNGIKERVAHTYNITLKKLGEDDPDFMAAVGDLTADACMEFNAKWHDPQGIFCQSFGSRLNRASSGRFPLNLSYHYVKQYDGPNDGLVGEDSFAWGSSFRLLTAKGKRGISHGDMIDLNRDNFDGFDVREFYVEVVADLKKRGL